MPQTARPEPSRPPVSNPLVDAFERPPGESEFIEAWNATEGTVPQSPKILGTKLAKAFREQIESDADWPRRARDACQVPAAVLRVREQVDGPQNSLRRRQLTKSLLGNLTLPTVDLPQPKARKSAPETVTSPELSLSNLTVSRY